MKRPLFTAGTTAVVLLSILAHFESTALCIGVSGISLLLFCVILAIKKKLKAYFFSELQVILLSSVFVGLLFFWWNIYAFQPAVDLVGENRQTEAVVIQYPEQTETRTTVIAKVKNSKGIKSKIKLSLSKKNSDYSLLEPGDVLSFTGNIYKTGANVTSVENSYKSKAVFIGAYPTGEVTIEKAQQKSLLSLIAKKRLQITDLFNSKMDKETASMGIGMLLGDKTRLDSDTYSDFRDAGVAHILAVSGMHLSIWILFFTKLFSTFGFSRRKYSLGLIIFVLFVMALTGFSASICRAGLMMILYLSGNVIGRKSDGLNSLGFAALIIVIQNPYSVLGVGLLLSLFATLSIFVLANPLMDWFTKKIYARFVNKITCGLLNTIACSVCISVSASLFTLPLQVYFFNKASLLSPVTNLLFYPVVAPLIVCFGLFAFLYFIPGLNIATVFVAKCLTKYCIFVTGKLARLPIATLTVKKNETIVFTIIVLLMFSAVAFALHGKNIKTSLLSVLTVIIAFSSFLLYNNIDSWNKCELVAYNVSDGLAVSVTQNKHSALIYYGSDSYHADYIEQLDYDYVFCDEAHSNDDFILSLNDSHVVTDSNADYSVGDVRVTQLGEVCYLSVYGKTICVTKTEAVRNDCDTYLSSVPLSVQSGEVVYTSDSACQQTNQPENGDNVYLCYRYKNK